MKTEGDGASHERRLAGGLERHTVQHPRKYFSARGWQDVRRSLDGTRDFSSFLFFQPGNKVPNFFFIDVLSPSFRKLYIKSTRRLHDARPALTRLTSSFPPPSYYSQVCKSWRRAAEQEFLWQTFGEREFGLSRKLPALRRYGWREAYLNKARLRHNWNAGNATHFEWQRCHSSWISSVAICDGRTVTGSYDRTVVVWDRVGAQWSHILKGHGGEEGILLFLLYTATLFVRCHFLLFFFCLRGGGKRE